MTDQVVVIGVGRVGLPLGLVLAESGFNVVGIDINQTYVDRILGGEAPFKEEGLEQYLGRYLGRGFLPTTNWEAVRDANYLIITVGTPVDENLNPVLTDLYNVISLVAPRLKAGQTIILRSTVSPHTTARMAQLIEASTSLKVGEDIFLAFCPERIAEGRAFSELKSLPQIIGGVEPRSSHMASRLFERLNVQCLETDDLSAELAKLMTNMFRYIQFAIANEFFMLCQDQGRNFNEVRQLINTSYSRGGVPAAGFSAGPCLFKDGFFLLESVPYTELIANSWRINEGVPNYLVAEMEHRKPLPGATVAILGMAFKADSDDTRQSLSFRMKKILEGKGALVLPTDPYVPDYAGLALEEVVPRADVIVIAVPHRIYLSDVRRVLVEMAQDDVLVCDMWGVCGVPQAVFFVKDLKADAELRVEGMLQ